MPDDIEESPVAAFEEDDDTGAAPAPPEIGPSAEDDKPAEKAEVDENPVIAKLMDEISTLRGSQAQREEADAELRAELAILRANQRQAAIQEEEGDPDFSQDEKQQILTVMAKDPVAAIQQILGKVLDVRDRKITRDVDGRIATNTRHTQEVQTDINMTQTAFPELSNDQAFSTRTEQLHRLIIREAGKPFAGSFYLAANAAKTEMQRKGTWKDSSPKGGDPKENGGVPLTLRERVRQNADKLIDERPAVARTNGFDPATEYSEAELRGVRAACKRYGITEKQYFSRFAEQRKRDTNYGRR